MELRLYDTLSREKRVFTPIDPDNVRMYVCGPTVYDFAHIGNARPVIVFDVLFRLLRHVYGENNVTYVRNITDVDDKINNRALRDYPGLPLNEAIRKVTEKTADQFQADVKALGCLPPTVQPRATEFVLPRPDGKTDMVTLIEQLIAQKHAYFVAGEVLFDTLSMPNYGALSGRKLEDQHAGARIAVDAHKKHPSDFVLWKLSAPSEPGWESPWGRGRPGWHIECSAMSAAYLGKTFDIHGGGLDLIFPHHENEIAQSCCAHRTERMANYWMHNGFLLVEGEKMSKSLGNFVTINDLLGTEKFGGKKWSGDEVRFAMLQSNYRQPLDWTVSLLKQSSARLEKWRNFAAERVGSRLNKQLWQSVIGYLHDDLNIVTALAEIDRVVASDTADDRDRYTVGRILNLLGLKRPLSNTYTLAQQLRSTTRQLAKMSPNDWRQVHMAVLEKPLSSVGAPRPVTQLLAAAIALRDTLGALDPMLSVTRPEARALAEGLLSELPSTKIEKLLHERAAARARKDFAESDRIRDELAAMGVVIKDSKEGTTWEIAR